MNSATKALVDAMKKGAEATATSGNSDLALIANAIYTVGGALILMLDKIATEIRDAGGTKR